jgi:hypothetical protein
VSKFLISAAAVTLTLASAAQALAGPAGGRPNGGTVAGVGKGATQGYGLGTVSTNYGPRVGSYNVKSYAGQYGKPFSHGIYYPGRDHRHWTSACWSGRYGCYCYWCPSTCCWYYWCAPQGCYYPTSYIAYAPPCASCAPTYAPPAAAAAPCPPSAVTTEQYVKVVTSTAVVPCTPYAAGQGPAVASAQGGPLPPPGPPGPGTP